MRVRKKCLEAQRKTPLIPVTSLSPRRHVRCHSRYPLTKSLGMSPYKNTFILLKHKLSFFISDLVFQKIFFGFLMSVPKNILEFKKYLSKYLF